ncbi:MAG: hypothetical protein AAF500_14610 [Myxococcota bacterium]
MGNPKRLRHRARGSATPGAAVRPSRASAIQVSTVASGLFLVTATLGSCAKVQPAPVAECPDGQVLVNDSCVDEPDGSTPEPEPDPLDIQLTDGSLSYLDFDPDTTDYIVEVRHLLPRLTLGISPTDGVNVVWQAQGLTLDADGEAVLEFFPGASDLLQVTSADNDVYEVTIERDASGEFEQVAFLKGPTAVDGEGFGSSVAASGDRVVVGGSDRVVVFRRDDDAWTRETEIGAPIGSSAGFGRSVAIDRETLVVGEFGAAYVFTYDGSAWAEQEVLQPGGLDNSFGVAVAVHGDTVVVGASSDSAIVGSSGAAYVFVRSGTQWTEQGLLKASNAGTGDSFGASVAIDGDSIIVGARGEDSDSTRVDGAEGDNLATASDSGAAYLFARTAADWSQTAYLKATETILQGAFGWSVDIDGDRAVVGAPGGDDGHGEAHVFSATDTTWAYAANLRTPNPGGDDVFGQSVAIDRGNVIIGAGGEDSSATGVLPQADDYDDDVADSGAGYVFVQEPGGTTGRFYLKALNAGRSDYLGGEQGMLGTAVAISGDTVVVGAPGEDSDATDVDGSGGDNSAAGSGAAYIFR